MNFSPRVLPLIALTAALTVTLPGCSQKEPAAADPAAAPAASSPAGEDAISVTRGEEVKLEPAPRQSVAEQAQTLRQFILDTPACEPFHAQLNQASLLSESGQPVSLDMGQLMDDVYKAGCQKSPSGG
jgi:hypothetical protein